MENNTMKNNSFKIENDLWDQEYDKTLNLLIKLKNNIENIKQTNYITKFNDCAYKLKESEKERVFLAKECTQLAIENKDLLLRLTKIEQEYLNIIIYNKQK